MGRAWFYLIVSGFILGYGIWYAKDPSYFLGKKFHGREIPPASLKTGRVVGVILAVIGGIGVVYHVVGMILLMQK